MTLVIWLILSVAAFLAGLVGLLISVHPHGLIEWVLTGVCVGILIGVIVGDIAFLRQLWRLR